MAKRTRMTWHLEYSWKRARILIAAALMAVVAWRVVALPIFWYLDDHVDWISVEEMRAVGFYNLYLEPVAILALMVAGACVLASARTEAAHRANAFWVAVSVAITVIANYVFSSYFGMLAVLVTALSLVPVVLVSSCVVVRNVSRLCNIMMYGVLFSALGFMSAHYYSDEEVAENWLHEAIRNAAYGVSFSHYYAKIAPERLFESRAVALARAPQMRELSVWQTQFSQRPMPWGTIVDGGANEDFLDYSYRAIGDAVQTPLKMFDLREVDHDPDEPRLSDSTLRNSWLVYSVMEGVKKNAYVVTDEKILRCLTDTKLSQKREDGLVFVAGRPEPDVALEQELLHCFDGQTVHGLKDNLPVELLAAPCAPLHGFGNYSADPVDVVVAFMMRLWVADVRDYRGEGKHFFMHALGKDYQDRIFGHLILAQRGYDAGNSVRGNAELGAALELMESRMFDAEMSADKRDFLTSLFASYRARIAGDEQLAGEYDAACLAHRARWYENDPQAALLARTARASDSIAQVAFDGHEPLLIALGLSGEALGDVSKPWTETGFWLRRIVYDRQLVEHASTYFGSILDSFVSTRHQQAEYEHVRKLFARNPDYAFYELMEKGLNISRYYVGTHHNGWCSYRLKMQYGAPIEGMKTARLASLPRYCRVDDVLVSFDEKGQPARRWDATGLPFHAPVVVGDVERLRGLSVEHRAQRTRDDERDALLYLFLEQLTAGALDDVEALNLELHPGAHSLRDDQRAAMERMRLGGKDLH